MNNKTITVIGSCRIHNPFKKLRRKGLIQLNNKGFSDLCHAPREIIQKIRCADGRFTLPKGLEPMVIGKDEEQELGRIKRSDLIVIEISSVRRLHYNGCEMQINYFLENFIKKNNLQEWFETLSKKARNAQLGTSVKHPLVNSKLSDSIVNIASNIEMTMESNDNIKRIMQIIVNDVNKPVLFVGHFNVYNDLHSKSPDRERLNKCIKTSADYLNAMYCDPTVLIEAHGSKTALRDNNHWDDNFLDEAAMFYYNKLLTKRDS